ncbi:MAG: hypothetical protein J4G14_00315 [Dehalococcoidia bacterium]|nr:hypothetical protein [Dehalococcoidia bacterium]
MTQQPLSQIPRPSASSYEGKKNLFLVPNYVAAPGLPQEALELIEKYWSEVRDSIGNLERTLGSVSKVYHEMVCAEGDEGLQHLEVLNPTACTLVRAMCQSTATMRQLEDGELVAEHSDWQRVLTMGPASQKVLQTSLEGYQETLVARYKRIADRITEDLAVGDCAVLFIREDHQVQFPTEVQVFYVAPPSLDALKRWLDNYFRSPPQPESQQGE